MAGDRLAPEKAVEAVRKYRERGLRVFPLPVGQKKPDREKGWRRAEAAVTDDNLEELWKNGENIGAILDRPWTDIDLDSEVSVRVAPYFLPNTPFKFGRGNLPGLPHWVYLCEGAEVMTFIDPIAQERHRNGEQVKSMLLEIRTGEMYTVFPPSVHPSGYRLKFPPNWGWPEAIIWVDLRLRSCATAATSMMVTYWPGPGARNEATMALCGGLVRAEREKLIAPELVDRIVRAVVDLGGNSDPDSDYAALERTRRTFGKIAAGADKRVKGWATLEKLMGTHGKLVVRTFRDWLGILPKRQSRVSSALQNAPWADELYIEVGSRGERSVAKIPGNVAAILTNDPAFRRGDFDGDDPPVHPDDDGAGAEGAAREATVYFDEFRWGKMVSQPLPWDDARDWRVDYPRQWVDADVLAFQKYLAVRWGLLVGKEVTADGVDLHASENHRHEIREYLESLAWDGVPRLDAMGPTYFGTADDEYERVVLRYWMISAVARALDPGCQADNTIILEGPQGLGKTSALASLAVRRDWFTDGVADLHDKSSIEAIVGAWIVEIAELGAVRRGDVESVKAFLTRREDKYRPPYGRETVRVRRGCVFAGTINPGHDGYLRDPTGNRRFLPVACTRIDLDGIERDRDQLWAEAADAYRMGEHWHVTDGDMRERIAGEQRARAADQGYEAQLLGWLNEKFRAEPAADEIVFTVAEALVEACGMGARDVNERRHTIAIGNTCQSMGFRKVGRRLYSVSVPGGHEMDRFGLERVVYRDVPQKSVAYAVRRSGFLALLGAAGANDAPGGGTGGGVSGVAAEPENEDIPF